MKQLFHIREQNKALPSKVQALEAELSQAESTIQSLQQRLSDPEDSELKEAKSKLRIMTTKFSNVRKERDQLKKDNRVLQQEILELQANMRSMIPSSSNTSSSFPMANELVDQIAQFYKCDCEDLFFDVLAVELSLQGLIFFFQNSVPLLANNIYSYFAEAEQAIKAVTNLHDLEGPILNVLRKSYQNNWRDIFRKCVCDEFVFKIVQNLQAQLRIDGNSPDTRKMLLRFFTRFAEVLFCLSINDPPFNCAFQQIGQQVEFNSLMHDAIDGFIRTGDKCFIILPQIQKNTGECVVRSGVLRIDYELS